MFIRCETTNQSTLFKLDFHTCLYLVLRNPTNKLFESVILNYLPNQLNIENDQNSQKLY